MHTNGMWERERERDKARRGWIHRHDSGVEINQINKNDKKVFVQTTGRVYKYETASININWIFFFKSPKTY